MSSAVQSPHFFRFSPFFAVLPYTALPHICNEFGICQIRARVQDWAILTQQQARRPARQVVITRCPAVLLAQVVRSRVHISHCQTRQPVTADWKVSCPIQNSTGASSAEEGGLDSSQADLQLADRVQGLRKTRVGMPAAQLLSSANSATSSLHTGKEIPRRRHYWRSWTESSRRPTTSRSLSWSASTCRRPSTPSTAGS